MEIFQTFLFPHAWLALLTLTFLEIVLGIDNVVFISIMSSKLPANLQSRARTTGLLLAMLARIMLLFGVSLLMQLTRPLIHIETSWLEGSITGQSLIVLAGGLFLLYKSVTEVHDKLEGSKEQKNRHRSRNGFWRIIIQIVALDMVFSFDSVLTAVGMVSFREFGYAGAMAIMIMAIVIAIVLMLCFSGAISRFVNQHPTIQMLALSFLILIAVMLLVEAAHLSGVVIFGSEVNEIPKGYIYFAIAFSLGVELLNMKINKKSRPVQLHDSRIKQKTKAKE